MALEVEFSWPFLRLLSLQIGSTMRVPVGRTFSRGRLCYNGMSNEFEYRGLREKNEAIR